MILCGVVYALNNFMKNHFILIKGTFVAIILCFLNGEVINRLKREWRSTVSKLNIQRGSRSRGQATCTCASSANTCASKCTCICKQQHTYNSKSTLMLSSFTSSKPDNSTKNGKGPTSGYLNAFSENNACIESLMNVDILPPSIELNHLRTSELMFVDQDT